MGPVFLYFIVGASGTRARASGSDGNASAENCMSSTGSFVVPRDTTFLAVGGRPPLVPPGVRYVITLDTDTRLPIGAAKRLIGKMAHPLNRPKLDPVCRRVVEGYGVLQPRVTPSLPTARDGSVYQRVFSSPTGIDPYAAAVSDVYQDLFEEGSYSGKGIYDVDAFEAALAGRIADSSVLSHDLLESIFARAGLVSDVEVFEDFPSRYDVAASRQHRWARGDWQLLPWIVGRGPATDGGPGRADIPLLGRWKLADNLRRTLSAPASFFALLTGWVLLPPLAALLWCGFVLFPLLLTAFLPLVGRVIPRRSGVSTGSHFRAFRLDLRIALLQFGIQVALLAHQAWLMVDAIVRTLSRLYRRRNLLEWVTAAAAGSGRELDLVGFYRRMAGAVALATCGALIVAYADHGSWMTATPLIAAWMLSPAIAWWVSRAPRPDQTSLSDAESESLRLTARRTWHFFENIRHGGGSYASSGQFSGGSPAGPGAPDLADKSWPLSSLGPCRARFRLARHHLGRRPIGRNASDNGSAGAIPRSFLQLV